LAAAVRAAAHRSVVSDLAWHTQPIGGLYVRARREELASRYFFYFRDVERLIGGQELDLETLAAAKQEVAGS
jgi:hypothetical protein